MLVFHLHIPRTGGIAVRSSLKAGFKEDRFVKYISDEQVKREPKIQQEIVAVTGHYRWGLHKLFARDHLYFIVLRDPAERVLSVYDYVIGQSSHEHNAKWLKTPLRQLLTEGSWRNLFNGQTRLLAGIHKHEPVSAAVMEQAWQNLCQENVIVTFTDILNDGLLQLGAQTGIHFGHLRRVKNASKRSVQSDATVSLIKEKNALDIELYGRARSSFMDRLDNPARLPDVAPLQVYRERIAEFRESDKVFSDLTRCRRKLAALRKGTRTSGPAPVIPGKEKWDGK